MIIDTDNNILIFNGEQYVGLLEILDLKHNIVISNGKEYNLTEVTAYNEVRAREV